MGEPAHSDEEQLAKAADAVVRGLGRADIPDVVVCGLALGIWGQPRSTYDVDVIVATSESEIDQLCAALTGQPEFVLVPSVCPMLRTTLVRIHLPDHRKYPVERTLIDILVFGSAFAQSVVDRRVLMDFEGRDYYCCSAEDLVVMKCLANRPQDLLDVSAVLKRRGDRLDREYVDPWANEMNVTDRWETAQAGEV